ncbi:FHA domain-containing protein FhaB/FipA [Nigerium massiliense]|uniref:FHA domain-containing protein FhaB/FipA n=1 Tax=Nigerium massiliense TaxID=1522317 RepID=UPI00058C1C86|nr:FHA domain-containing protein [Nigerium massiliense]
MSELVVLALKFAFLALLWLFVLFAGNVIRTDLFGKRVPASSVASPEPVRKDRERRPTRAERKLPQVLRITRGAQAGLTLPLNDSLRIGRSEDCQLILDDEYVSTRHARVFRTDHGYAVEDLGSTNGTYLNDARVTNAMAFGLGDTLRIGRTLMVLEK